LDIGSDTHIDSAAARSVIAVDMDERAFLFPETRAIAQLKFTADLAGTISIDFVYAHNASHMPPSRLTLQYDDAKQFCLRLVDAIYRAQTQNAISDSANIAITMAANGYIFIMEDSGRQRQLYLSTSVIWRVCNALCRMVDVQSPIAAH
jgi:hypothetical protein